MSPKIAGTGLIALDVVYGIEAEAPQCFAGGTCGNVLTIMNFLGWESLPIGRLGADPAGDMVRSDLRRWGLKTDLCSLAPMATPIIVERIREDKAGARYHTFSWSCPQCGERLPGYSPVTGKAAEGALPRLPAANVFFFDRASRGALVLARDQAAKGAIIVFEPSGLGQQRAFREAMELAHIVKYSHERRKSFDEWLSTGAPLLEIETLGRGGLRYRSRLSSASNARWHQLTALEIPEVRDTVGAGDWCTAGVIYKLCGSGTAGLERRSAEEVEHALSFGQALAAWNCTYEGARGGMYRVSKADVLAIVQDLLAGEGSPALVYQHEEDALTARGRICTSCKAPGGPKKATGRPKKAARRRQAAKPSRK